MSGATGLLKLIVLIGLSGFLSACGSLGSSESGGFTTMVSDRADTVFVPASNVAERQARAWAGAAMISEVVKLRSKDSPEDATQALGQLASLERTLETSVDPMWASTSLYYQRVAIYKALGQGIKQRISDFRNPLGPLAILSDLSGLLDLPVVAFMREDVICHFASLDTAEPAFRERCETPDLMSDRRGANDLVAVYTKRFKENFALVQTLAQ